MTGFRFFREINISTKTFIFNLTETAIGNVFAAYVFKFEDNTSVENLVERVLQFDSVFIERQHLRVIYKHKKIQMFQGAILEIFA